MEAVLRLLRLSAAFLSVSLVFGCQDSPTIVAPDDSPLFAKVKDCTGNPETDHPSCKTDDSPLQFNVSLDASIGGGFGPGDGDEKLRQVVAKEFNLNALFITGLEGEACIGGVLGNRVGILHAEASGQGSAATVYFFFPINGISHELKMDGIIRDPTNWLPAEGFEVIDGGDWKLKAQGRNRANGCSGEGNARFTLSVIVP